MSRSVDLSERLGFAFDALVGRKAGGANGPPGGFSLGTTWLTGPATVDPWGVQRGPSPYELIESFKSVAYFCTNTNANAVASTPLRLYTDSSKGNGKKPSTISDPRSVKRSTFLSLQERGYVAANSRVDDVHEIRNHPMLDVLDRPDPDPDGFDRYRLIHTICRYCDVVGACYLWPNGPKNMPPRELWPLFSQYVLPIRKPGQSIIGSYTYFAETFQKGEIIQFKHYISLRDPYGPGYPPLYAALSYLKLEDRFVGVQDQLLAMGPRPNLLASPKDPNMPIGEPERQRFMVDLNRQHARGAQGGVLVVNGSWDISPLSYAPTDLAGLKIAEYDLERSCSTFDCPIEFFTPDTNLANLQAAEHKHATKGVNPRCHAIAARLTRLVQQYDPRLFFAFDDANKANDEAEAKVWDMKLKNGSATINQANAESAFPPVPWGDKPWLPNNVATPDMLEKAHEQSMKTLAAGAAGLAKGGNPSKVGKKNGKGGDGGRPKNPRKPARAFIDASIDPDFDLDVDHDDRGTAGDGDQAIPRIHGGQTESGVSDGRSAPGSCVPRPARPGQPDRDGVGGVAGDPDRSLDVDDTEDEDSHPFRRPRSLTVAELAELPASDWARVVNAIQWPQK